MLREIAPLDDVLRAHARVLGRDLDGYRNHAYRVANFCLALVGNDGVEADSTETHEKVALAAAFHDIGIWTAGTFDYLEPSVSAARAHLATCGRSAWAPEISAMIRQHHKVTRSAEAPRWLVEPFRKADWVDVTHGLVSHGLPRRLLEDAFAEWPDRGFHWRLVQLTLGRLRRHPLSPLPMLRL